MRRISLREFSEMVSDGRWSFEVSKNGQEDPYDESFRFIPEFKLSFSEIGVSLARPPMVVLSDENGNRLAFDGIVGVDVDESSIGTAVLQCQCYDLSRRVSLTCRRS